MRFAAICLLLIPGALQAQPPLPGTKPNIVVILADDLSYRDLSIWGQIRFSTPNLDRLAAEGVRFTQAYAGAPECAPSRGTLMTGLHTGHASVRDNRSARGQDHLADSDVTISEMLKRSGYATGFFGSGALAFPALRDARQAGFRRGVRILRSAPRPHVLPRYLYRNGRKVDYPGNFGFDMGHMYEDNQTPPGSRDSSAHDEQRRPIDSARRPRPFAGGLFRGRARGGSHRLRASQPGPTVLSLFRDPVAPRAGRDRLPRPIPEPSGLSFYSTQGVGFDGAADRQVCGRTG